MSQTKSRGYRWIVLMALTAGNAGMVGVFFATPAVAPFLQADLGTNRAQIGLLMAALLAGAAIMATPGGWLADKSIRWNLLCFEGLTTAALFIFSRAVTLEQALLAALGAGIGAGAVLPAMTKAIATWFPNRERATAIGIFFSGASAGSAASAAFLPSLSLSVGWRQALVIMAMVILSVGIASFALYRDSQGNPGSGETPVPQAADREKRGGLSRWSLSLICLVSILLGGPQYAFATYLILYLSEALDFPLAQAGLFLGVAQASGVLGRIGWGIVSDKFLQGNRKGVLLAMGSLFTASLAFIALGLSLKTPLLLLMFVIGISGFSWYSIWTTWIAEGSRSASAVTIGYGQALSYVGVIIGPPLFGYVVDTTSSYTPAWIASALLVGISTMLMMWVREAKRTPVASLVRERYERWSDER